MIWFEIVDTHKKFYYRHMDRERRIIKDGAIYIEKDRIMDVGKTDFLKRSYSPEKIIDAAGKAIVYLETIGAACRRAFADEKKRRLIHFLNKVMISKTDADLNHGRTSKIFSNTWNI